MLDRDAIKRPVIAIEPETAPYGAHGRIREHPLPCDAKLHEAMTHPVLPADPLDPAKDAPRPMREEKIGCLPVLEGQEPVGIDLLDALIVLTGTARPGAPPLPDRPGGLARPTTFSVDIHPVADNRAMNVLRVESLELLPLAEELWAGGFEVVRPPK